MVKTITITAYNRPDNLRMLLDSLRAQLISLHDYTVAVSVDIGGDKFSEVMRVAQSIDFAPSVAFHSAVNIGTNLNSFWLMQYVFGTAFATDWNVYLEDDLVLSPDAFNLVEWYIYQASELRGCEGVKDIGAFCLCRLWEHGPPENVYLSRAFTGWGFLMDSHQWEVYGKPVWRAKGGRTWDTAMAAHIRTFEGVYNAFPALSRVTNTGRGGTRFTPAKYDKVMRGHRYNQGRKEYPFQFVGVV